MPVNEYKTNNRTKIMDFLIASKDRTVSAADIGIHMEHLNCPVNMTTIYRYLDKLEKEGTVIKYTGTKSATKASGATYQFVDRDHRCEEHLHLKCTECGAIVHLDCHFMDVIAEHIKSDHGFDIQCKNSVIYGVCRDCRRL